MDPANPSPSPIGGRDEGTPEDRHLDDCSTAEAVIGSYYNAINTKQHVRAYYYWEPGADPT